MTAFYSIVLVVGVVALILWVVGVAAAAMVDEWSGLDPEVRFGSTGRSVLAFVLGFGLGGISATFAGWSAVLTVVAAGAGGVFLTAVANWLGPETTASDA